MTRQGNNFEIGFATTPATVLFYAKRPRGGRGTTGPRPSLRVRREGEKGHEGRWRESRREREKKREGCDAMQGQLSHLIGKRGR